MSGEATVAPPTTAASPPTIPATIPTNHSQFLQYAPVAKVVILKGRGRVSTQLNAALTIQTGEGGDTTPPSEPRPAAH
jgi:hypothetical protein